jgi:hypothetical protein
MSDQLLSEKRLVGDLLYDNFINGAFSNTEQKLQLQQWLAQLKTNKQVSDLPLDHPYHSICKANQTLPAWADSKLMQQGAMVLYLSERMRSDAEKRLYETAEFVWEVMAPDAFTDEGSGFAAILKVRLMHAAVRYYTMKSGKWDKSWGFPVNQEDMAGTNLSFSLIVIRGLRQFGYTISYKEQSAYMHLWNVIGYLLGVDEALIPNTGKAATNLEEAIRLRQFAPSEQGRDLTASLIAYFYKVNDGSTYTNTDIYQLIHYLLGDEVAELLGIKGNSLPSAKIRLLKLKNSIQELTQNGNSRQLYGQAVNRFKQAKPYS